MPLSTETLRINGVDVVNCGYVLLPDLSPIGTAPAKRTGNVAVAQRHGAVRTPHKRYDVNTFPLLLWIRGVDPITGAVPADPADQFYDNYDALMRIVAAEQLHLEHVRPDGTSWFLDAEVLDRVDHMKYQWASNGSVGLSLTATDPFWRTAGTVTANVVSSGLPTDAVLTAFAPSTAPIEDAVVRLNGPASNPILRSGDYFLQYNRVLTAGQWVQIDCATFTITTAGVVKDYASLVHAGLGPWFALAPTQGGPTVTYDHDGVSASTASITARNAHLGG
jgi:hypothetical protein